MIPGIDSAVTRGFDLLLAPFARLHPFWGILVCSLLTSVVALLSYRWFSRPGSIRRCKDQAKASILAIRIYRDSWQVLLTAFFRSLWFTLRYFALNLVPILAVLPLLFLLFVQMDIRYGRRPFLPGEEVVLKVALAGDPVTVKPELLPSASFRSARPPVFATALGEADYRLVAVAPGQATAVVTVQGQRLEKRIVIGGGQPALANDRQAGGGAAHLIDPAEAPFPPGGPVRALRVHYPARTIDLPLLPMNWMWLYLILVFAVALGLKDLFGVEF